MEVSNLLSLQKTNYSTIASSLIFFVLKTGNVLAFDYPILDQVSFLKTTPYERGIYLSSKVPYETPNRTEEVWFVKKEM